MQDLDFMEYSFHTTCFFVLVVVPFRCVPLFGTNRCYSNGFGAFL